MASTEQRSDDEMLAVTRRRAEQLRARRARRRALGVGLAVVALVAVSAAVVRTRTDDARTVYATDETEAPVVAPVPSPGTSMPLSEPEPGDTATWDVDAAAPPTSDATSFTASVTRLSCSNGVTGTVLRPGVVMTETEVVVTFTAESLDPDQGYFCPGNDAVPYTVELGQPIGPRTLIDGACVHGGEASTTTFCADSAGVRWRSDGAAILRGNFSVTGQMVSVGGPAGVGPDPTPGEVRALDIDGRTVATATTNEDGTFQLLLPNGSYRVAGRSDLYQSGQVDCTAVTDLVVHDRWVDGVTVMCQRK